MIPMEYPRVDERLYREVLPNGLTVMVCPRKGFSRKIAYFLTDFGAIHRSFTLEGREYQVPAGVAHYLEHKLFDMPGDRDVTAEFAALGASVNAFTGYDMTAYYFSCTENFSQCLKLLVEFVSTPWFTRESVEKERGIIDQEIGMNEDSPDSRVYENLVGHAYTSHPIHTPILGTRESIREITPDILELCHRAFYAPGNMILCVVGDVDPEEVKALALEVLGQEKTSVGRKLRNWSEPLESPCRDLELNMEVAMPMFSLVFKCRPGETGEALMRRELTADLASELLFGESSALYQKLYEEGVIDASFGGGFEVIDGCTMLMLSGDSDDPQRVRREILAEAARLCREGVDEEEFLRMKRSALGSRIKGLDSFDSTCYRLCAYHITGFDYFDFPRIYEDIQPRELLSFLAEAIREENSCLSVVYPND